MFKDKILLITGGTGSFGNALIRRFVKEDIKEINDFLTYVQENIYKIYISAISYNDKEVLDEILRIISTNSNVTKLSLTNLNNINLSDILS